MEESPRKRRAVRKGTRNCWECRRRKVRCVFASPTNASCSNCFQRRSVCVSQEFERDTEPPVESSGSILETRLERVEQLLQFALRRPSSDTGHGLATPQETHVPNDASCLLTPDIITSSTPKLYSGSPPGTSPDISTYSGISRELASVWPSEDDLVHICNLPIHLSTHLKMRSCISGVREQDHPQQMPELLRLPPPGTHPVLIAHKLLILASLLQGALSKPCLPTTQRSRFEYLLHTTFDASTRLVTTNDNMPSSIELIECSVMEAMIRNHEGKLHQAWRAIRRATTIAQILGLHRKMQPQPLAHDKFLDAATRNGFDPERLCFHITCMDSYLSLTLGLPHAAPLPYAQLSDSLHTFDPIDRMARLQCKIAERLLHRTTTVDSETLETDHLLLSSASQMPHSWWLVPDFASHTLDQDSNDLTTQLNYQLSHYHLLTRLYLPYVLQPPAANSTTTTLSLHAKRIVCTTSRSILTRYLAFRAWNRTRYYCRGTDYLALIALTVLCVLHIDSRCAVVNDPLTTNTNTNTNTNDLAHAYPSDRATMEKVLAALQWPEHDDTAAKLAGVMQSLLDVEAAAAAGVPYSAEAEGGDELGGDEYASEVLRDGDRDREQEGTGVGVGVGVGLVVKIPYFGAIALRQSRGPGGVGQHVTRHSFGEGVAGDGLFAPQEGPDQDGERWGDRDVTGEDWTLANVNQALFVDLFPEMGWAQ